MTNNEKAEHFKNALSNYAQVLNRELEQLLEDADRGLLFPESPHDVLDYLGNTDLLALTEIQKEIVRALVRRDLQKFGAVHVWRYRIKVKLELYYIYHVL